MFLTFWVICSALLCAKLLLFIFQISVHLCKRSLLFFQIYKGIKSLSRTVICKPHLNTSVCIVGKLLQRFPHLIELSRTLAEKIKIHLCESFDQSFGFAYRITLLQNIHIRLFTVGCLINIRSVCGNILRFNEAWLYIKIKRWLKVFDPGIYRFFQLLPLL